MPQVEALNDLLAVLKKHGITITAVDRGVIHIQNSDGAIDCGLRSTEDLEAYVAQIPTPLNVCKTCWEYVPNKYILCKNCGTPQSV